MEEPQKDLEEVKALLRNASRKRIHAVLLAEQNKLEKEIKNQEPPKLKTKLSEVQQPPRESTVEISNYAWNQSDKFVKIYLTLKGVQHLLAENVQVHFTERSVDLLVKNLGGKNYYKSFNNLLKPISPENSARQIKADTILIFCKKEKEEKWGSLNKLKRETKKTKEKEEAGCDTSGPSGTDKFKKYVC